MICIECPQGCCLTVTQAQGEASVSGNACPKGKAFAIEELTSPMRSVTTTVATSLPGFPVLPVRTSGAVPKSAVGEVCRCCGLILLQEAVHCGDIIIENVANTGVSIIATRTASAKAQCEAAKAIY